MMFALQRAHGHGAANDIHVTAFSRGGLTVEAHTHTDRSRYMPSSPAV